MRERIAAIGTELVGSLERVLSGFASPITNAGQLTKLTGLNRNSASKIMMALGKREALASLIAMPGPEALRKLVAGARRAGLSAERVMPLEVALARYEHLLEQEFEGKPALDGAIALWLPEVRERVETANRHLVYRGMSALRGISVDTSFETMIVSPNAATPERCDVLFCAGMLGMRRVIPGAPLRLLAIRHRTEAARYETVDGAPMERRPIDGLLREYCSKPTPTMTESQSDDNITIGISEDDFGIEQSLDLVFAEVGVAQGVANPEPGRRMGHGHTVVKPTRELVLNTFVHRDLWQGLKPECVVYDTAGHGNADPRNRKRDIDLVPQAIQLAELGEGLDGVATPSIPNYRGFLTDMCGRRGWNPAAFRGFRFTVTYPIYAGQYAMVFTAR
ncbi:MAG: hypothetical protein WC718_08230 [Phycisphaerales bacterium]